MGAPISSSGSISVDTSSIVTGARTNVARKSATAPALNVWHEVRRPGATNHYHTSVTYTIRSPQGGTASGSMYNHTLINRTGHPWQWAGERARVTNKVLGWPASNWPRGRVAGDADYRTQYQNEVRRTWPTFTLRPWPNEHVHHMRPLAYGGTHAYSNLIHLDSTLHGQVTGWFAGY